MTTIQIEIPDGKEAKWVNGVLTLVDDKPVEFKFKVGDKVKIKGVNQVQTIISVFESNGIPVYKTNGKSTLTEEQIELYTEPQDITERINTFTDAYNWCFDNKRGDLCRAYTACSQTVGDEDKNLIAYLKLRIITCALNEGWEPTFNSCESRWRLRYNISQNNLDCVEATWSASFVWNTSATTLYFKSKELALYAATLFKDIYMDFCYKGKE